MEGILCQKDSFDTNFDLGRLDPYGHDHLQPTIDASSSAFQYRALFLGLAPYGTDETVCLIDGLKALYRHKGTLNGSKFFFEVFNQKNKRSNLLVFPR